MNSETSSASAVEFKPSVGSKRFDTEVAPCFYNWRELFPELEVLLNNIEVIKEESKSIGQVSSNSTKMIVYRLLLLHSNEYFCSTVDSLARRPLHFRRRCRELQRLDGLPAIAYLSRILPRKLEVGGFDVCTLSGDGKVVEVHPHTSDGSVQPARPWHQGIHCFQDLFNYYSSF